MRIVHLKLTHTCNRCEFACISAHGLREHMKSFHKETQKRHVGENLQSRLSSNMLTYGKAGSEKCLDCSFRTYDKNKLADHRAKFHQVGSYK